MDNKRTTMFALPSGWISSVAIICHLNIALKFEPTTDLASWCCSKDNTVGIVGTWDNFLVWFCYVGRDASYASELKLAWN